MRKIFFLALLLLQLAATAYAYTNKEDGFKTLSPSSDNYIEAAGSHFYGFNDGITAGYAEAIMPEQADKFLGSKFNSAAFDKKYEDILLLQRNGISSQRINKLIANPFVSPLVAFTSTDDLEYSISAQKFGKNKYIAVAIKLKNDEQKNTQPLTFYYTSANNRLYLLLTENSIIKNTQPENVPENTVGVIGGADAATAITVTDKNAQNISQAPVFLKKFKTIKPQPEKQPLSFTDKISGYTVNLPDDWFYFQLKDTYNEQNVSLSAALPFENFQTLLNSEVLELGISDIDTAIEAASTVSENKDKFFGSLRHGILLGSIKMRDESWTDKIFTNPQQAVLETKQTLEELKTYFIDNQINLKTYDYDVDIADEQGSFYLQTELNPADSDFYYRLFAEGKVFTQTAFLALIFDRTDDSESMAYKFWNNKAVEQ